MQSLLPTAEQIAQRLKTRNETIAVAESSAGGLIAASLLTVPGASSYFLGGAVIYTRQARGGLLDICYADLTGMRPSTESYARLLAGRVRLRLGATWGLSETGAVGPTGNRYGDPAGHACLAICGPVSHELTIATGSSDRLQNMQAFAQKALEAFLQAMAAAERR